MLRKWYEKDVTGTIRKALDNSFDAKRNNHPSGSDHRQGALCRGDRAELFFEVISIHRTSGYAAGPGYRA